MIERGTIWVRSTGVHNGTDAMGVDTVTESGNAVMEIGIVEEEEEEDDDDKEE